MSVVLAGGSGFIGRALTRVLNQNGHDVICVSRRPSTIAESSRHFESVISWVSFAGQFTICGRTEGDLITFLCRWMSLHQQELAETGLPECDAVINLSGENIMQLNRRWTPEYQQAILTSRVLTTKKLADSIQAAKKKPKVFITASGVGYYQPSGTFHYDEYNKGGSHDFLAQVTEKWEAASRLPESTGVRVVNIRTGAVLGRNGGVIKNMYWPFLFGVGGPIGSGKQPFPWIHIEDIAHLYLYAIENEKCQGVYNGVAPQIITNADFTRAFAKALHRPAVIPIPAFILNGLLGPDRASILTQGQMVHPKRAIDAGFEFLFPKIDGACEDICATSPNDGE